MVSSWTSFVSRKRLNMQKTLRSILQNISCFSLINLHLHLLVIAKKNFIKTSPITYLIKRNRQFPSAMSNNTSNISISNDSGVDLFVTYYPLVLIIVGTLLNLFTFVVLCRPIFQDTHKRPTIHYMRVIAIFDILMLYGWNFDHYLAGAHGFTLQLYNIPLCKLVSFLNYFAGEVSAWIRVFVSVDRYLSLSRLHKTWFSQSRNVLIIIAGIIVVFTILNSQFLLFACFYTSVGKVNPDGWLYPLYPLADYLNLAFYNCVPFISMVFFNSGVIYHLIHLQKTSTIQNSRIHHRSISITLVITTFLYLMHVTYHKTNVNRTKTHRFIVVYNLRKEISEYNLGTHGYLYFCCIY